ncbi:MAG: hypothetical protein RLN60_01825 [Phycisphaerales bacterium]
MGGAYTALTEVYRKLGPDRDAVVMALGGKGAVSGRIVSCRRLRLPRSGTSLMRQLLDTARMARAIDPSLHRQRRSN